MSKAIKSIPQLNTIIISLNINGFIVIILCFKYKLYICVLLCGFKMIDIFSLATFGKRKRKKKKHFTPPLSQSLIIV